MFDCHKHNLFSFDWMIIVLADKVDMNDISDKFENWPDPIINLRVTLPSLPKKPLIDFVITITSSVSIRYS